MSDTKVISIPSENGNNSVPAWLPYLQNNNGGGLFGGNNGWGGGILGFFLGLLFGNGGFFGGNGFGGWGGGNGAGFLSNQINNDQGRDLLMQAITSQGEQSRAAVQTLSTMLGQDFNLVNSNIQTITQSLNQIANTQGMNALQVINAIQSGNCQLGSQLQQCCCQNQMAIMEQTNALQNGLNSGFNGVQQGINGVSQAIAAKSAADQLAMCQQTYALTDTMNRNYLNLDNKIDAMESNRKDREITALTAKVAQLESQNFTAGAIQQAVAPVLGQLSGLRSEVDAIKRCQPSTITLPNNQFTVVPTLLANAGADFVASYWANRTSQATTGGTTAGGGAAV